MASISFRFTEDENTILDFVLEKSHFENKKSLIMHLIREKAHQYTIADVVFPDDMRVSDKTLISFIELDEFKELDKWSSFVDKENWDMIIKQSRFKDMDDFENQRKIAYEKAGLKYKRVVLKDE